MAKVVKLETIAKFKSIKQGDTIYNLDGFKMTVTSAKVEDGKFTVRIKEDDRVWFQLDEETGRFESRNYTMYANNGVNFTKGKKFSDLKVGDKVRLNNGKVHKVVGLHFDRVKIDMKYHFGLLTLNAVPFKRDGKGPKGQRGQKDFEIVEVL